MALYLLSTTAIEFNYSHHQQTTTENETIPITGTTISIISQQNRVFYEVYGVGIKQMLSSRKARIRPSISFGYAKQFIRDSTDITLENVANGDRALSTIPTSKSRIDSVFGTFTLQLYLTKFFSINGSVYTVFKAFETNQAKDNMKYLAGFSWYL